MESVEPRKAADAAQPASPQSSSPPASPHGASPGQPRIEVAAWYYDPRSSRPTDVRLLAYDDGRVLVSGVGVDVECAAAELRIRAPILGATLDAVLLPNGGQCELYDKDGVERLRRLSGAPVPFARIYRCEQSWPLALAAVAVVVGALLAGYLWVIPLGAAHLVTTWPALAQKIGRGTLRLLDTTLKPTELDEARRRELATLFARVGADYPEVPLKLELRKAGFANAFALPDGTIVLTDEIVRLATHDDQLEGVIYHEIGHVAHGHGLRHGIESATLAAIATAYYGDADQVTALASGLPIAYGRSRYSREEETEADGAALEGLTRHGKDLRHYADILRALEREAGPNSPELRYFASHPDTHERIRRFEAPPPG